jgi:signal-transduction protein with cAMP-binding, CBS, and nucleotidyltransferase domain
LTVIKSDMHLEEAIHLTLDKKIKKLPVIEETRIIGLLSLTDIVRCQPHMMKTLKAFLAIQDTPRSIKKVVDVYIV